MALSSSIIINASATRPAVRCRPSLHRPRTSMVVRAASSLSSSSSSSSSSPDQGVDDVTTLKKQLLAAVAASRRPGSDPFASKRQILDAVSSLEALAAGRSGDDEKPAAPALPFASVSGRWSLVYSTNDEGGGGPLGPLATLVDEDTFQRVSNQLYKLFFSFAPALAGSSETGANGVSNEQIVDLPNGRVVNNVDIDLPFPFSPVAVARVGVSGEVEAMDPEAREVVVTFTEWEVGPALSSSSSSSSSGGGGGAGTGGGGDGVELPRLRLPLPRPRGVLKNTFCDDTLRLSRGGRGGVFITSRLSSSPKVTSASARRSEMT